VKKGNATKALFDTSVLVPALIAELPQHVKAAPLLRRVHYGELLLYVSAHTLAETYATLTALPLSPQLSPGQAGELVRRNVLDKAQVVSLESNDYQSVIHRMIRLGLSGGAIYDALHVRAAEKAQVEKLYTFNGRDFTRMPPSPPTELVIL